MLWCKRRILPPHIKKNEIIEQKVCKVIRRLSAIPGVPKIVSDSGVITDGFSWRDITRIRAIATT
jgi:hypothetical protein